MRKLFENSGNQLFKYRGQIPLVLVLIAIIVIYCHPNITDFTLFFGKKMTLFITIIFIFFGHLIRALVVGTRGMHTSGKNRDQQVAHQLNNTGLYSMVRHPLYLGNLMIWIGIFYWVGNFWFLLIGVVFFILLYFPIMRIENDFLEEKFGEEYVDWSIKTPLFLPNPLLYKRAVNPFSFKMVWKNEYPGIVSSLSSIWFVSLLRLMFTEEKLTISITLLLFALAIALFGFGSRFLKHKTNFFPKMG
jgi:protein-S-isoprenylcysteine O-methyltransferase Ste14